MTFGNPIWLWGLTGLSLPLAIHLLSRKEGTVILIGSLRHLSDSNTQQFKSLKLNEILLLILRMLLITALVLFLADLRWPANGKEKIIIVDEEVKHEAQVQTAVDSLAKSGYELMTPIAFAPAMKKFNAWHLAEICQAKKLSSVVVIASDEFLHFKGQRVPLPPNVKWIGVSNSKQAVTLSAISESSGQLLVREGQSVNSNVIFDYRKVETSPSERQLITHGDTLAITDKDTVTVYVHASKEFQREAIIINAALRAMQTYFPGTLIQPIARQDADWIIWLSDEPAPRTTNIILLSLQTDLPLFQQDQRTSWTITQRLNESIALEENLTLSLASILLNADDANKAAEDRDIRNMPEVMMWSNANNMTAGVAPITGKSMERLLLGIFFALLLAERLVAYQRNQ